MSSLVTPTTLNHLSRKPHTLQIQGKIMSECPLRTDTEHWKRLTSANPLIPLPNAQLRNPKIAHAPKRNHGLSAEGKQVSALANIRLTKFFQHPHKI